MTENSDRMKRVVTAIHPLLKDLGFKKRQNTFNRETEPGLVQVINFQLGPYNFGAAELPPYRMNVYGKFTVNLGIYIHEVHTAFFPATPMGKFVPEYHSEIRTRLTELMDPRDVPVAVNGVPWWSLESDPISLANEVQRHLFDRGIPYLDLWRTRDRIVEGGQPIVDFAGFSRRRGFVVGMIELHRGRREEALSVLQSYLKEKTNKPEHCALVRNVVRKKGLEIPD